MSRYHQIIMNSCAQSYNSLIIPEGIYFVIFWRKIQMKRDPSGETIIPIGSDRFSEVVFSAFRQTNEEGGCSSLERRSLRRALSLEFALSSRAVLKVHASNRRSGFYCVSFRGSLTASISIRFTQLTHILVHLNY